MTCEIVDAMRKKKHILVEAGVGIGKSFAYIVPLIYYQQKYYKPVIIATSTIALQEQLTDDIKKVQDMINYKTEILSFKGKNHFLCKRRFNEYFTKKMTEEDKIKKTIFMEINKGGYEKSNWNISISDDIWEQICIKEYSKKRCDSECAYKDICHYRHLRKELSSTKGIIVCNQDLLIVDMDRKTQHKEQLLSPDVEIVVIDEAHNLEDKVRNYSTKEMNKSFIKSAINGITKIVKNPTEKIARKIRKANDLVDKIFYNLHSQIISQQAKNINEHVDIDRYYIDCDIVEINKLSEIIKDLYFKAQIQVTMENGNKWNVFEEEIQKLEEVDDFLKLMSNKKTAYIFWMSLKGKDKISIFKCPKKINEITKQIIFSDSNLKTILTSATITTVIENGNKNYDYFIQNIDYPFENNFVVESKTSPFSYDDNSMIYYTENLPHPTSRRKEFIEKGTEEIIRLLRITNGKTLILFTAKTDMDDVYKILKEQNLPYEVLKQNKNSSQNKTVLEFKNNINSVLLATGSFWEGISIEGEALSSLIIFKLPFPMRDPIIDYKLENSKNGLMEVLVPEMIIKLEQGVGRLIRNETDRGIISIIDSRVGDNSDVQYKDMIWNSLPTKKRTNDLKEIEEFYKRLCK